MKKNKRKRIIKQITCICAIICTICLSILPCFAFDESGATATNIESVPLYFRSVVRGYFVDENTANGFEEQFSWGTGIAYQQYSTSTNNDESIQSYVGTYFSMIEGYEHITIVDTRVGINDVHPNYTCTGFSSVYNISSGNYLIDTDTDTFSFNIATNIPCNYAISGVYTILTENNSTENLEYFSYTGQTTQISNNEYKFEFNLSDYIYNSIGYNAVVLINALTIEWSNVGIIGNQFATNIKWEQSSSISERNFNGARINYDGTVSTNQLNYYNTVSEAFENFGIEKYKSSFINYTADYTSWIGEAVGGFLNMEIFPYFSIGGILLVCVALGLVGYFLKVFLGG